MLAIAPNASDIKAFQRGPSGQQGFMRRQQQLGIANDGSAGFFKRGEPVDQMTCGHQYRLLVEQIFHLRPVDDQPLIGGNDDILLQAKVGRAQPYGAITAAGRDRSTQAMENRHDARVARQDGITAL